MADVLVDTDVFVDHLRGHRRLTAGRDRIAYSMITRAELFAGQQGAQDKVSMLLAPFTELEVDRAIAERGGALRRGAPLALPDALIAATALVHGLVLVTRNVRHFVGMPDLEVRAPT
jgi:predicted nucleic acid-binding protein